jgi:broad specificity phosphatase PhoE
MTGPVRTGRTTVPRLVGLQDGPARITLVRHGESVGNLADAQARAHDAHRLDLDARDADVTLSEQGERQASALRDWWIDHDVRPTLVLSSPYERAHATARTAVEGTGLEVVLDERLRERDLGVFDGMTGAGIRADYRDEADRRSRVGKFYYQPPSGESWADVVLRVRSLLADLRHGFADADVWAFTHQAVIMSFRYVLEGLTEQELLEIDRTETIENVSLTVYTKGDGGLVLDRFADTEVLERSAAPVTDEQSKTGTGSA